jgi:hypothetical protein
MPVQGWQIINIKADIHAEVRALATQQNTTMAKVVASAVRMYRESEQTNREAV